MAVMAPGQGTGFVSVGDYLDANRGTLANEGAQIGSGVGQEIDAARTAADNFWQPSGLAAGALAAIGATALPSTDKDFTTKPGYQDALDKAIAAKDDTAALGSAGGVSDYFQKHFGDTRSQGDFDASLLGSSGFGLPGLQSRASGLTDYLNTPQAPKPLPPPPLGPDTEHRPPGSAPGHYSGPSQPVPSWRAPGGR